jgi:hypothetical protein
MTQAVAIELIQSKWAYVGKASGQRKDESDAGVYLIGGNVRFGFLV